MSGGGSGGGAPSSRRATRAAAFAAGGGSGLDGYARFEGLDFEETENTVYRSDQASQGAIDSLEYSAAKWAVCLMIGAWHTCILWVRTRRVRAACRMSRCTSFNWPELL